MVSHSITIVSFVRPVIHYTDLSLQIYYAIYFLVMYSIFRIFKTKFLLGEIFIQFIYGRFIRHIVHYAKIHYTKYLSYYF